MGGMRRMAVPLSIVATLAIAMMLFNLKQRVGGLEKELTQVNRDIGGHREAIQVLRTEWSFLNQPARIAEQAKNILGMGRIPPNRLIRLEDLPVRAPAIGVTQVAGTPPTVPGTKVLIVHTGNRQ
jgi:cell division protein FtsL